MIKQSVAKRLSDYHYIIKNSKSKKEIFYLIFV